MVHSFVAHRNSFRGISGQGIHHLAVPGPRRNLHLFSMFALPSRPAGETPAPLEKKRLISSQLLDVRQIREPVGAGLRPALVPQIV
jgi:hypothetical protein